MNADYSTTLRQLAAIWRDTPAAPELGPIPAGRYEAEIIAGALTQHPRTGTLAYKLTFRISHGPHTGRKVFHDIYLTPNSAAFAKRELGKLGVVALRDLERPLPSLPIACVVQVVTHTSDAGAQFNRVQRFRVITTPSEN